MSELNVGKLVVSQGIIPPSVATQNRPTSPIIGSIIYNISLQLWEQWTGSSWIPVSGVSINATGGTISHSVGYKIHTFTGNGTFSVISGSGQVEYLIVAGGGGGGSSPTNNNDGCGGGGAGGLLIGTINISPGNYPVTVGAGGVGVNAGLTPGTDGQNSSVFNIIAVGGGGGATQNQAGRSGGSGGGAGNGGGTGPYPGGSGTPGQGNDGGNVTTGANNWVGAGGGGAGAPGRSGNQGTFEQGQGGEGLISTISGVGLFYAGGGAGGASGGRLGGGGGNSGLPPRGGIGGGADGGYIAGQAPSGSPNSGGGGGGALGNLNCWGGNGGSGIVVVRYRVF
jgi:hypothetical protein